MGAFAVGNVVLLPFPFSDLSGQKKRPALILAYSGSEYRDWVCLQITSQSYNDKLALPLAENEFAHGTLHRQSYIRPGKIFTAHESLFTQVLGQLRPDKLDQVKETVIRIIQQGGTEP
ncbi:type II toxin-antitoxin system PemK/MazF family toxin [Chloracidobacterium sp. MS 40/45]|jgi:mRNA interferase MazF|uniref:type II toxin-antitoxin system PemK/MazF family toxin n=1 Tax=Chloracidobacterium aggregatum TaxID=2851959 RepID=UPI001B8B15FF|nr:type II toxin-antitoxin system PemK/MazF family toxin [Chloracidobacterium aggregatum]QUW01180.1 type II toxin-antitoxin system PemK/MazF family toxin [Chloracidobacterium sp. MS 40/45]